MSELKPSVINQTSCGLIEEIAISPNVPGADSILTDPGIQQEVAQYVNGVLIPKESSTNPDATTLEDISNILHTAENLSLADKDMRAIHDITTDVSRAIQVGETAERLTGPRYLRGLGCVACESTGICPIFGALGENIQIAEQSMSVLRELNKSVSEVNSNLEKQVIRQGVEIPTPDSLVTFLIGQGFEVANQEGSHLKLTRLGKDGIRRTSVIPLHNKRLPLGTFKGILEQSGMTYGEYALATKRGRGKGPKPRLPWLPTTITPETDDKQS